MHLCMTIYIYIYTGAKATQHLLCDHKQTNPTGTPRGAQRQLAERSAQSTETTRGANANNNKKCGHANAKWEPGRQATTLTEITYAGTHKYL